MFKYTKSLASQRFLKASLLLAIFSSCNSADTSTTKDSTALKEENKEIGFVSLFDGKTLEGWDCDTAFQLVNTGGNN